MTDASPRGGPWYPLPGAGRAVVLAAPRVHGPGAWIGAPSADGRRTKEENFSERTGRARLKADGRIVALDDEAVANVRYLDVLPLGEEGYRLYYEAPLPDGTHELRTELVEPPG